MQIKGFFPNFKSILKKNHYIYSAVYFIYNLIRLFLSYSEKIIYEVCVHLRKKKLIKQDHRYEKIKEYKNIHKGKRCFIVATGPSVTLEDLNRIQNEYTISMNSIINVFNEVSYRPTYYMCQDSKVYRLLHDEIEKLDPSRVFIGICNADKFTMENGLKTRELRNCSKVNLYHLDILYRGFNLFPEKLNFRPDFSENCSIDIKEGTTVVYSAIQLAAYMGFEQIYVIGIDASFGSNYTHLGEKDEQYDRACSRNDIQAELNIKYQNIAFYNAYVELKKKGVNLYNATRGGNITSIPRVEFESVL